MLLVCKHQPLTDIESHLLALGPCWVISAPSKLEQCSVRMAAGLLMAKRRADCAALIDQLVNLYLNSRVIVAPSLKQHDRQLVHILLQQCALLQYDVLHFVVVSNARDYLQFLKKLLKLYMQQCCGV